MSHEGCITNNKYKFLECEKILIKNDTIDLLSSNLNNDIIIGTDIIPIKNNEYSLGSETKGFKSLHISGNSIHIAGEIISVSENSIIIKSIKITKILEDLVIGEDSSDLLVVNSDSKFVNNVDIQGKIKNDLVIGEDSSDLLVVNSVTLFTDNVNINGDIVIDGNFKVDGETTYVNTNILTVDDKNIELGSVDSPDNTTADGGGITLKGATDKTIIWDSASSNWTLSEHINIVSGKNFKINNISVLNATTLGTAF